MVRNDWRRGSKPGRAANRAQGAADLRGSVRLRLTLAGAGLWMLCGCQSLARVPWVSPSQAGATQTLAAVSRSTYPEIPGFPGVRDRAGSPSLALQQSFEEALHIKSQAWHEAERDQLPVDYTYNVLVLGAGGPNGSFGAGLLTGWTQAGTRPSFDVVTGVSAGALLAPFAFAGPEFDAPLQAAFERLKPGDIYQERGLLAGLLGESLMRSSPLLHLIEHYVDDAMLAAIAQGHEQGRRLYIGTTDFDQGRLIVWDVGAIAVHRTDEARALVHQVLLASASIPVFYPPVLFEVQGPDGRRGDEMHVDGALASPMFLPTEVINTWKATSNTGWDRFEAVKTTLTVIHNGSLDPIPEAVARDTVDIALRSFLMISWSMVQEDVRLLYLLSRTWGAEFRFACIPDGGEVSVLEFGPQDAQRLFHLGFQRGCHPESLDNAPPVSLVPQELHSIQPILRRR